MIFLASIVHIRYTFPPPTLINCCAIPWYMQGMIVRTNKGHECEKAFAT